MYYEENYRINNGQLGLKGVKVNGKWHGYFEVYNEDGSVNDYFTGYFMNGCNVSDNNEKGYCLIWCKKVVV